LNFNCKSILALENEDLLRFGRKKIILLSNLPHTNNEEKPILFWKKVTKSTVAKPTIS
jgi:hypothetical protein